jgi:flagellar hook-basal body complex protein FliE
MAISPIALKAYSAALEQGVGGKNLGTQRSATAKAATSFAQTIEDSLSTVNDMQIEKGKMIQDFASGKSQNVHELMISLQKAGLAMDMTAAVRNKVMSAYQELMRIQF